MKLKFAAAIESDASQLAALHRAAAEDLTLRFGHGFWSSPPTERGILVSMRKPKFSRTLIVRTGSRIVGTLRLATKKPWAIDTAYFTKAAHPLYLTGMAVHPTQQHKGIGRLLMQEAEALALFPSSHSWDLANPADAIRLDAFDAKAGAGPFYAKCGFRELAHVVYKNNPLVYFERILPATP
ncbi:MAG: GNAT family N-acetyltransferase [Terracidiphilus sp.]|jgi:GNAT superfamily N-acetyltransferase